MYLKNLKNMGWINQDGYSSNIYEQRKIILKICFIGMQVIHLHQNYLYVIHYGNEIQLMILRVIRFCLSVPEEQYVQNGLDRALIRRSTENYLT